MQAYLNPTSPGRLALVHRTGIICQALEYAQTITNAQKKGDVLCQFWSLALADLPAAPLYDISPNTRAYNFTAV
jgi:hypothetical protein